MWLRSRKVWAAGLSLWALALLLPRPGGHPAGTVHWPPQNFCVYYGRWDSAHIARAHRYQLIIAHPGKKLEAFNADLVSRLRSGADGLPGNADDSLVLAYLSLGEDEDPPPGPWPMPTRYLDRKRLLLKNGFLAMGQDGLPQESDGPDGIPDRNGAWGSYYVRPMDAEWRKMLEGRLEQLAARGVDGFFLDTVDVAPDLRGEMIELIESLHARYPKRRWLCNRGVDLFQKEPARMRSCIDGVVLESWFTRWDWTWGRAVPAPDRVENERLLPVLEGVTRLYLDYLDPGQPDRGKLIAARAGHEPAFWTHPFLDRLEGGPTEKPTPLPPLVLSVKRLADGRVSPDQACVAVAVSPRGEFALPGEQGPWAVGDARQLRLRRVTEEGAASPELVIQLPIRADDWTGDWTARELETRVEFHWSGQQPATIWLGETPEQLRPLPGQRDSGAEVSLEEGKLYWVSLSKPGGPPDRARPVRAHDITPPPAPQLLEVRRHSGYLTVAWAPVKAPDLGGYRVYISPVGGPLSLPYTRVGETNLEVTVPPEPLEVRVTSFDTGNHESQPLRMALSPPK